MPLQQISCSREPLRRKIQDLLKGNRINSVSFHFFKFDSCNKILPVGENIVSPAVRIMYCGNCHSMCMDLLGAASMKNSSIAVTKNEIAANIPPRAIRCNDVRMPIFFNAGYKYASNSGIMARTSSGL